MAFCLGPFCGRFHDELEGSDSSEDDDPDADPDLKMLKKPKKKGRTRGKKKKKKAVDDSQGATTAGLRWAPYMSQIQVDSKARHAGVGTPQQVMMLRVVNVPSMPWNSISQLTKVHTLEIIRCHLEDIPANLNELDNLCVFRLSHNHVRKFTDDLAKCNKVERIIMDWNEIHDIPAGVFSYQSFLNLEVLNLSHNKISFLPEDFGLTKFVSAVKRSSQIKYIDLSYNSLTALPTSILYSTKLEVLNLSHNKLQKLPDDFEPLEHLQKLFVSFNVLRELPGNIGKCAQLAKIRIVSNQIRELPPSIINLWKVKNGKLDEFLVDRNPLVMPSITAFEMGGESSIDQAFKLFEDYLTSQKEAQALDALQAEAAKKLREAAAAALKDRELDEGGKLAAITNAVAVDGESLLNLRAPQQQDPYYFSHCDGDTAAEQMADIRNTESSLLLIKKNLFVEEQKKRAKEAAEDNYVPENLKIFMEKDFNPAQFNGKVCVMDLDLYFNLLVFATKPMFSSCALLFDKFEIGDKGFMSREEWNEFCMCVPVSLSVPVQDQMWQLMSWRQADRITLTDFVAAWHIHDVGTRDPWIKRVAEVLRLDYYDMTTSELRDRLHAKDAQDATPQLDFDQVATKGGSIHPDDDFDDGTDGPKVVAKLGLENAEGTRRIWYSPLEEASKTQGPTGAKARAQDEKKGRLLNLVSLTDAQHVLYENELGNEGDSEGDGSKASLSSKELSEDSGEGSDFDAQVFLLQRQDLARLENQPPGTMVGGRLFVDSDEAMQSLMTIPPEDFFKNKELNARVQAASGMQVSTSKSKKQGPAKKEPTVDLRLKTDVFAVRQGIRMVYRNMPYNDFVKLVNFLLRGMQLIKHSAKENLTYWHADDPTFKHTMGVRGTNEYTRALLEQMGFVLLNDIYWIWPSVHLDRHGEQAHERAPTWGDKDVPQHCPGRDRYRLDDMICLLKSCQRTLHQKGKEFKGHFPLLSS